MTQLDEHKYPKIKIRDDSPASYDYLMSMDLYKLTEEEIIELKKRREIKQTEFETLNNSSATDLWETDLDNFMKLYSKDLDSYDREHEGLIVVKKKRVMKKKNK
jgi:hypothetical protein